MLTFSEHSQPKVHVTLERYKLYNLYQKAGQTFDDFLLDIKTQVDKCEFESMWDDFVLYKIVGGIDNDEIRNVLIAVPDLKVDEAVQICRTSSTMELMSGKENNCRSSTLKLEGKLCTSSKFPSNDLSRSSPERAKNDQEMSWNIVSCKPSAVKKSIAEQESAAEGAVYGNVEGDIPKKLKESETEIDNFFKENSVKMPFLGNADGIQDDSGSSGGGSSDRNGDDEYYVYDPEHRSLDKYCKVKRGTALLNFPEHYVHNKMSQHPIVDTVLGETVGAQKENIEVPDSEKEGEETEHRSNSCCDDGRANDLETKVQIAAKRYSKKKRSRNKTKRSEEPQKIYVPCEICGRVVTSKYISAHKKTHIQGQKFICYYCGSRNKLKRYLIRHIARKHPGIIDSKEMEHSKTHVCKVCGYKTTNMANMRRHKYQHTEDRPFSCELCEYKCIVPRLMKAHMAKHAGKMPLACSLCSKGFIEPNALKRHMITHMPVEEKARHCESLKSTCEVCGKIFCHKGALKTHLMRHTGEKPFACDKCGFRTTTNGALTSHITAVHSEEKPFVCSGCDYNCKLKTVLQQHMKTHTGEKPYGCEVCGKKFSQSGHVKRHMLTHTGEKPYVCDICGHSWTTQSNLKAHIKVHKKNAGDSSEHALFRERQKPIIIVVAADSDETDLCTRKEYAAADAISS